ALLDDVDGTARPLEALRLVRPGAEDERRRDGRGGRRSRRLGDERGLAGSPGRVLRRARDAHGRRRLVLRASLGHLDLDQPRERDDEPHEEKEADPGVATHEGTSSYVHRLATPESLSKKSN